MVYQGGCLSSYIQNKSKCRQKGTFALLYTKIKVKFNHFLFLTSLESPLNKGGSDDVWKYKWLQIAERRIIVPTRAEPNLFKLCRVQPKIICVYNV